MELQDQINLLYKRMAVVEGKLKDIETQSPSPPTPGGGSAGSKDAWLMSKKMEAKQRMADQIKGRYSSEVASGVMWDKEEYRLQYVTLKKEIRELNEQIASM